MSKSRHFKSETGLGKVNLATTAVRKMDLRAPLFFVCSCFVLFKGQTVSACPLVMTPSSVVVAYGEAFSVDCNATTTDPIEGMGWESTYKGTGLIESSHVQLHIEKVDRWTIMSQCFINLEDGTQCPKTLPIIVYKIPDNVSLLPPNTNQPMEEHREYEFQCAVVNVAPLNKAVVKWYKDDIEVRREMLSPDPDATPQNRSSVYKLRAQKSDNGGKLKCEATFNFGPTGPNLQPVRSPPVDLQVVYQPFFQKSEAEMVEAPADRRISLDCTAQGNPAPQYRWQVPQPTQQRAGSGPILDLKGPFPGTYNCTAFNSQGSSIKQFVVTDAPRDYTVLAAVVGVTAALGVLLLISGPFIVTKDGTFSLNKGQPSQPI